LCDALIVVEAPVRSGARNAAKWARRLGRPCFVVPSPPWIESGRGCIAELQLGARALGGPEEVMQLLEQQARHARGAPPGSPHPHRLEVTSAKPARAPRPRRSRKQRAPTPAVAPDGVELEPLPRAVLDAIRAGAEHPDQIAERAGLSASEVNHGLLRLTLGGHILLGPLGDITTTR